MPAEVDQLFAFEQPQQRGVVDPREGLLPIATEEIEWAPAERRRFLRPSAVEKAAKVVEEDVPSPSRHVGRRAVGMEAGKFLGPLAGDFAIMLDDRRAFVFGVTPDRRRIRRQDGLMALDCVGFPYYV
jgi:hypothetical protein